MIGVYFRTEEKTQHTPAPRERGGGGQKGEKERGQEKESVRQRKKKEGGQKEGKYWLSKRTAKATAQRHGYHSSGSWVLIEQESSK